MALLLENNDWYFNPVEECKYMSQERYFKLRDLNLTWVFIFPATIILYIW